MARLDGKTRRDLETISCQFAARSLNNVAVFSEREENAMAALPKFVTSLKNALTGSNQGSSQGAKIVPMNQGVAPVSMNGQKLSPHEFLEAQILNLPDEEESIQKRALLSIAYFLCTWGGSAIMIWLGFGLALDLQSVFHINGIYASALAVLFPFAEFVFEILAILIGERVHQGLKTRGDWTFVLVFAPFVLLANLSTALLQVFLLSRGNEQVALTAQLILWFRAALPLLVVIATIGVVAGIQRRSLSHMIKALERKTAGINQVAQAAVKYMESEVAIKRLVDEHQEIRDMRAKKDEAAAQFHDMMKQALEDKMNRLRDLEEKERNGRNGRY
jgi:hypothetical protein